MIRIEDVCFASLLGERKEKKGARTLCFTLLLGERKEEKKNLPVDMKHPQKGFFLS
jgi:hypothetical protein